jgi:hypothetical protein
MDQGEKLIERASSYQGVKVLIFIRKPHQVPAWYKKAFYQA